MVLLKNKVMKVPEKIYLQPNVIEQLPHQNIIYTKPLADNSIEYICTDAFIEKVCEYFEPILTEYAGFYVGGEILQHFKDYYMKGK